VNKPIFSPRHISLLVATFALLLGILACGGGAAPAATELPAATEAPAAVQSTATSPDTSPTEIPETPQPALPERRYLTLEFPPKVRAGDSDVVRLTLEVDDKGNIVPTAQIEGNVVKGQAIEIPNLYETHHVIAEARFDIAGVEVKPSELISEPLTQGTSATFYWSIRPTDVGKYRGTIWLYLRFVNKATGEESRNTVSAQIVDIEATNFLGLSANLARSTGVVGSVLGTIIGFPFLEDIVKLFFKKRLKP
jgi:hypothetical protein